MKTIERQIIETLENLVHNLDLQLMFPDITTFDKEREFHDLQLKEKITRKELSALKSELSEPEKDCENCDEPIPCNLECESNKLEKESGKLNKTAEEILDKYPNFCYEPKLKSVLVYLKEDILKAMYEFASQFQEQPARNTLIDFLRENNWLNLEDEANATRVVDSYLKVYGEEQPIREYLNECIEKATPNLSKIKDVDKELAEIRGEQLITDEMINKEASKRFVSNTGYVNTDKEQAFIKGVKWALSLKAQPEVKIKEKFPDTSKGAKQYKAQPEIDINTPFFGNTGAKIPVKAQPGDEDIWNAAKEYAEEHGRAFYSEHFQAYKDGATECRDKKIYVNPDGLIPAKEK